MRHLSAERLAAVADEPPTPDEAAHLAQCGQCAQGRDAQRRLIAGAALERDRTTTPLSSWGAISAQLRAEGIIRTPDTSTANAAASGDAPAIPFARATRDDMTVATNPVAVPMAAGGVTPVAAVTPLQRRTVPAWAMRAAAALLLVAGGALVGRVTADGPTRVAAQNPEVRPLATLPSVGHVAPVSTSAPTVEDSPVYFASTTEAKAAMLQAERMYQAAMHYLAQNDSTLRPPVEDPVEAYRTRLAALDEAVAATRKALKLAPTDPVINNYYLTSVNARETTLRQIDDALPVNERVTRF